MSTTVESILNLLPFYIYRVDLSGRLTYANEPLLNLLGISLGNAVGQFAYDFFEADKASSYQADDQQVVRTKTSLRKVQRETHPGTGERRYVEMIKTPVICVDSQDVIGVQSVFFDDSELFKQGLHQAEKELLLTTIAEQSPDYVFLLDDKLHVKYINQVMQGLERDKVIGAYLPDLSPTNSDVLIKELNETLQTGITSRYRTLYPAKDGKEYTFETRVIRLDNGPLDSKLYLVSSDVTEFVEQQFKLKQAAAVFENSSEAIFILDPEGFINQYNEVAATLIGYVSSDTESLHLQSLINSEDTSVDSIFQSMNEKGRWQGELKLKTKARGIVYVLVNASLTRSCGGEIENYIFLITNITDQVEHQKQLEHVALYDALTGLPNRQSLELTLQEAMAGAKQSKQRIAVLYIDLDGFKEINDQHGHHVGDQVLINIALKMKEKLSPEDVLTRIGGDEFVVIVNDVDEREGVERYFHDFLVAVSGAHHLGIEAAQLSASLGVTYYPQDIEVETDHLIRQADIAMYQAKLHGKNQFETFDVEKDQSQRDQGKILAELEKAIIKDEFVLNFQPKVNMKTGEIVGAEALIRWQHYQRGFLFPDSFLPFIEPDDQLLIDIDNWVIAKALEQLNEWNQQGYTFRLSINLSTLSLEQRGFSDQISTLLLAQPDVRPEQVVFEILESSLVSDFDLTCEEIKKCQDLGIEFSLDDFGTGFSSLDFLKRIPADELKVDRSFVMDMLENPQDLALVRGIIGLAQAFEKNLVAEGVETEEQGVELLSLGCEYAQGYVIAKPMNPIDFLEWAEDWRPFPSWLQ